MSKPKKWYDVYPYGTQEGDEEAKVFRSLSRNKKFEFRSTGAIIKATGLPRDRVEEIIDKYATSFDPPLIYPHPTNDDHWGYWERCEDEVLKDDKRSISKKDKDNRIDKHLDASPSLVVNDMDDDNLSAVLADEIDKELAAEFPDAFERLEAACKEEDQKLCDKQGWTLDL